MKNSIKLFGIIIVLMIIVFSGCDTYEDNKDAKDVIQTPVADDFIIGRLNQSAGSVLAATITPKTGKSTGIITIKYDNKTDVPQKVGNYAITFDIEATNGWNSASGLIGGTLIITAPSGVGTVKVKNEASTAIKIISLTSNNNFSLQKYINNTDGRLDAQLKSGLTYTFTDVQAGVCDIVISASIYMQGTEFTLSAGQTRTITFSQYFIWVD